MKVVMLLCISLSVFVMVENGSAADTMTVMTPDTLERPLVVPVSTTSPLALITLLAAIVVPICVTVGVLKLTKDSRDREDARRQLMYSASNQEALERVASDQTALENLGLAKMSPADRDLYLTKLAGLKFKKDREALEEKIANPEKPSEGDAKNEKESAKVMVEVATTAPTPKPVAKKVDQESSPPAPPTTGDNLDESKKDVEEVVKENAEKGVQGDAEKEVQEDVKEDVKENVKEGEGEEEGDEEGDEEGEEKEVNEGVEEGPLNEAAVNVAVEMKLAENVTDGYPGMPTIRNDNGGSVEDEDQNYPVGETYPRVGSSAKLNVYGQRPENDYDRNSGSEHDGNEEGRNNEQELSGPA